MQIPIDIDQAKETLTEEQLIVLENAFLTINQKNSESFDVIRVAFESAGYLFRFRTKNGRVIIKDVDFDNESQIVIQVELESSGFNNGNKRMTDYWHIIIMRDRRLFAMCEAF